MLTLLAESYLHRLDPFAIRFTESFGLRWYGLSYAAGFLIAWLIVRWMAATKRTPLTVTAVGDLMFYIIAGVLVGGRVGYAVFYDPALFIGFGTQVPFWDLLAISKGGMASHGGILGVIIACWIFARRQNVPALHIFDIDAVICTPGLFLGRLANFVNGELWGRPVPDSMHAAPPWWSVKDPAEILLWNASHPIDAPKVVALEPLRLIVGGDTTFRENVVEAARAGHEQVIAVLQPLLTPYYPSQLYQALTDGPILLGLLVLVWWKPRQPGVIGAWFLILYGLLRIASEQFRQPDEGVALLLGLSRGQVLSVLMILAGAMVLAFAVRRKAEPMGGLIRTVTT